jgi:hypothetical protein
MSDRAYKLGRDMVWSKTAGLYMDSFEAAQQRGAKVKRKSVGPDRSLLRPHESPELNLDHLYRMTDSIGILQHARLTVPNPFEGYCTDDNARALILTVMLGQLEDTPKRVRGLAKTYAAFLRYAFDTRNGRFHNFLDVDRHWLDECGSEDCHGRAVWALGTAVRRSAHWSSQTMAELLFERALSATMRFTSPRAWAFSLIGIDEFLSRRKGDQLAHDVREDLTAKLVSIFDRVAAPGWAWFEEGLTYDNAKLAHALIVSGRATGKTGVYDRGIQALRWLVGIQTSPHDQLRPIGSNGFYPRNGARAVFDQQPIEAHSTISACLEAYRDTADPWWYEQAQRSFDWFLGWNDLGLELYSPQTGGCRDGLHPDRSNENQGAESMLAFLLSQAEMRLIQNTANGLQRGYMATSITQ